jgi:hypothetical protein
MVSVESSWNLAPKDKITFRKSRGAAKNVDINYKPALCI